MQPVAVSFPSFQETSEVKKENKTERRNEERQREKMGEDGMGAVLAWEKQHIIYFVNLKKPKTKRGHSLSQNVVSADNEICT